MSTAKAAELVLEGAQAVSKAKDKATDVVDFAKILFKIDRSPIDVRFQAGDKSFGNLYGQAFFEQPFRNFDLYDKQEDVLNAVALGKISQSYGATVLRDKFNVKGLISASKAKQTKSPEYLGDIETKFKNMLASYINNNPAVQQEYEDLIYYGNLLKETGFKRTGGSLRITKPGYLNRAIDKAMDPNYLKEYGELPFRFKYMNALKDTIDPSASIYSLSPVSFSNALKQGEQIAKARGLDVNFYPPKAVANPSRGITGERYQIEPFATVNNGRTILPASLFAARQSQKAEKVAKSTEEFLSQFQIGERLDKGLFEFITPLRMRIKGNENKTFYQLKDDLMLRTAGNQQRMDQINRLFEGQRNVIALDHIQPQRFGGTNDSFNLRYIMESGHFSGIRQTAKESDDLTFFVNNQGKVVSREFVTDKTNLENEVYKKTIEIVDLVADGKIKQAEKLSDEIFFLVDNFKKVNPSVDFKLGVPFVPVKSGEKTITYIPYHNYKKLNQKQVTELFAGEKPLLQEYENLPNAGDSIQKSFDKAYDRLAPFIIEGKKLTEADRKGLFEMKAKGGAVGLQDGGDPGFLESVKKQFFEGQDYPFAVAPNEPIQNPLKDITPEQVIKVSDDIRLQGLEDFINKQKDKFRNQYDNENLSDNTRQYISSRNNYAQFLEDKKIAISKAQVCGIDPNAPGCQAFFPDGKFVNGITNEVTDLGPGTVYDVMDFYDQMENTDYFKDMFARAKGLGKFSESTSQAKKEVIANSIKKLPLDTANLLVNFYQFLSPTGIAAG